MIVSCTRWLWFVGILVVVSALSACDDSLPLSPRATPEPAPTNTATATAIPSSSPTPTYTATATPTPTPSPTPTYTATATPTPTPSPTPTHTATPTPTPSPTPTSTLSPTSIPTTTPTPVPTPTLLPTITNRAALVALYNSTDGTNWRLNTNWLTDAHISQWAGVITDANGHVKSLDLSSNQLSGKIPWELGTLSNLESLDLSNNQLNGEIPPEIGNLSSLEQLYLPGNPLTGEIPPELGRLSGLKRLSLFGVRRHDDQTIFNQFTGCLPENLHQLISRVEMLLLSLAPCTGTDIVVAVDGEPQVYNDNVVVLPVPEANLADGSVNPLEYARFFYQCFNDAFDFLVIISNLYFFETIEGEGGDFNPTYWGVSNNVQGIGLPPFSQNQSVGSAGKLQGVVRLQYTHHVIESRVLLHELMHRWGNSIIPPPGGHWGLSSANGMIGGFDIADLVDLGEGLYVIKGVYRGGGTFNKTARGPDRYSPIELYVAGLLPAEEVPDLWMAEEWDWHRDQDGWPVRTDEGYRVIEPSKVRTITIEDIIAEHGERIPDSSESQREFRAAAILLVDEDHPAYRYQLDKLSTDVAAFSFPGTKDDDWVNFYEATGGRATIAMDGLSEYMKVLTCPLN